MPEVRLTIDNEELNMKNSFNSEIMITKSENKAIETLIKIIKKTPEPKEKVDLLFRLTELYMRRAKSGRFFDLDKNSAGKLIQYGLSNQKAVETLKQAIKIYNQIRSSYPQFHNLDYVLFNNAMAHLQIKEIEVAKSLYSQLLADFPNSDLTPDALLELGEIYYQQQNFSSALEKFKALKKHPKSRAYPYGLYKSAWCYYNLKNTTEGINQLLAVVKENPANSDDQKKYNLRREALRDLTLFVGETLASNEIFDFFEKITTENELGEVMLALSTLYESHSRYKEISVFTRQYINRYPYSSQTVTCYTKLIETSETLKLRPNVIDTLTEMSQFCRRDKVDASCFEEFRKISLEISKKWWDIWLKNKNNMEFANLTERAFENLLSVDNEKMPDFKSRYTFAELLFQQGKYEQASKNYEAVSLNSNADKTMSHDSLYAALFSIEKLLEKNESPIFLEKQKNLSLRYLKEFSNGEHSMEIQYKLGYLAYKNTEYDASLNYVKSLFNKNKHPDLKLKSEDLALDIYNIKKDYVAIQNLAKEILKNTSQLARILTLKKIIEEAHYSQIQHESKNLTPLKRINLFSDFANNHINTKLGQEAYWQSISLAYAQGFDFLGAHLSLKYIKLYPDDKRKLDALKEALKAFMDSGNLKLAIIAAKDLSEVDSSNARKYLELMCDLLKINTQHSQSRSCYRSLLVKSSREEKSALLSKLMQTFDDRKHNDYLEIQNQILNLNIEPYATEILTAQAQELLAQKKYNLAFNLALKINARPVDSEARSKARLIQAEILENEFILQSVKAQENRLALVISIKTEKLDKAFTAYSSAIKMSKTESTQLQGLRGISRLYSHYIDAINNIPLPETLNSADKEGLKKELARLTQAFVDKNIYTIEQIKKISSLSLKLNTKINWNELSFEKPVLPQIAPISSNKMNHYYPDDSMADVIKNLIKNKKYSEAEKISLDKTSVVESRFAGLYYLSLIADANAEPVKSLWFLEKAKLTLNLNQKNMNLINYQNAKVLYSVEDINSALKFFEKILDTKDFTPEVVIVLAMRTFLDGDYLKASSEFARLSTAQIYTYGMDIVYIESVLLKGEINEAIKLATLFSSYLPERGDLLLEQARIFEHFVINKEKALYFYQKALVKCDVPEQQLWLKRKIEYLKTTKNKLFTSNFDGPS